jgi:hypothetical protein
MALVGTINSPNDFGFKNRIINGAMVIDQRNAGASTTGTTTLVYPTDRFASYVSTDGTMTFQQSSTVPAGFNKSVVATTTVADSSLAAGQRAIFLQRIEGFNIADFGWGTANAKTVTLSFWVRSSLTGTFGGAFTDTTRGYPFTYTISSANTWEQKSITILGDTSGSWNSTNGWGVQIAFGLGVGSTFSGTAGAWVNGDLNSATGAVSVIGTLNATWYITGVQLEVGSQATAFDYRDYGNELRLCQRYYYRFNSSGSPQLFTTSASPGSDAGQIFYLRTPVPMRTGATCSSTAANTFGTWPSVSGGSNVLGSSFYSLSMIDAYPYQDIEFMITLASSPGTQTSRFGFRSSTAYIDASAEL